MSGESLRPESAFEKRVPEGDNRERDCCTSCDFVHYENPKIIVGSVVRHDDRYLLCRRSIEPRRGYWTLPAGFLEQGETPEEGAAREAREEANAKLRIESLLGIYSVRHISQVQLLFLASFEEPGFSAGPESEEVELFTWDEIPWGDLAFSSVPWALEKAREVGSAQTFVPYRTVAD
ncbi:MAG: NUDIX hydrolase [Planctomycetota bacterium]